MWEIFLFTTVIFTKGISACIVFNWQQTGRCSDVRALPARDFNSVSHMQPNVRVGSTSTVCIRSSRSINDHKLQIFASARVRALVLWAFGGEVGYASSVGAEAQRFNAGSAPHPTSLNCSRCTLPKMQLRAVNADNNK